jgi:uncharacterized 2Fe-2S/4Fe-4S cluster protein (DUF4445 family)
MALYKRRHRRRAGIKGCCGMCMLQQTDGTRNGRLLTQQAHLLRHAEEVEEVGERPLSCRAIARASRTRK